MKRVAVIVGSDSDLPTMEACLTQLRELGISSETHIFSAHRTPDAAADFAKNARENDFGVIIAAAGKAAHLAGALAARTTLPVIGVPVRSSTLDGLDALLSTVQMPSGIPVATVAINGGMNAGILAAKILAVSDDELLQKLKDYSEEMKNSVVKKAEKLDAIGYGAYLEQM